VAAVALLSCVGCSEAKRAAHGTFTPSTPGRLVVATDLPATGYWDGADPAAVHGGFEWGIADALASRLDVQLEVRQVPFGDIVRGALGGADIALSQVSVTDARLGDVDFTVSYDTTSPTALQRAGTEAIESLADAKDKQWVVQSSTTQLDYLNDTVVPDRPPIVLDKLPDVIQAVASGQADAALLDVSTALSAAKTNPALDVPAQFDHFEPVAIVVPKSSANLQAIDQGLHELLANGTVEHLRDQYLRPTQSADPSSIPTITARR
jgi:polar amino acid transport system substrate-binding protein